MSRFSECWESYYCRLEKIDQEQWRTIYRAEYFMRGPSKRVIGMGLISGNGYRGWMIHHVTKKYNGKDWDLSIKEDGPQFQTLKQAMKELGSLTLCVDITKPRPVLTKRIKYNLGPELPPIPELDYLITLKPLSLI